jgi:uncharacterized protein (TIGR02452 family)
MENKLISWDAPTWLSEFQEGCRTKDYGILHNSRIAVYENTVETCKAQSYISASGSQVTLELNPNIVEETTFYDHELPQEATSPTYDTQISVIEGDCLVEAKKLVDQGLEVCVLNLASRQTPGGGVISGSGAQEEYLFRCSDYFRSLYQFSDYRSETYGVPRSEKSYPMDRNFGGIFSQNVTIFRGPEEEGYPLLDSPWKANFIAVAAINRPKTIEVNGEQELDESATEGTKNKLRTIFRIAKVQKQTNLILCALGCGAFRNPPRHIARLFKEILAEDEFHQAFERIVFSIKADHNDTLKRNYTAFAEVFA